MNIDINKKYKTKDGREVVIHSLNGMTPGLPVIASVHNGLSWLVSEWAEDGASGVNYRGEADLIEDTPQWTGALWVKPGAKTYCAETTCFPDSSYLSQGYRKIEAVEKL